MSQSDFGVIDPNTKSGTQLAVDLNGFRDAVNSGHSGATRPAYLPAGGLWVRIVSSTRWDLVLYDGAVNHTLRSINPTTGQKIGIPAADLADKQTSATDTTAGRLLTVGAFGLGGAIAPPVTLDDCNLCVVTGTYRVSTATLNTPIAAETGSVLVVDAWNEGTQYQTYYHIGELRIFNRRVGRPWIEVATSANNFGVNGVRIDVASYSTVNLTTAAPNTLHINITGTTAITRFTVAAGQTYFVRFNAALTLTNNASIVTQSGANITTAAGDTCILRATAANVVEVLAYTPFLNQAVGYGQIWQDVTGSRVLGTTYTNSTGKPIAVSVNIQHSSTVNTLTIGGVAVAKDSGSTVGESINLQGIVPNGATYSVSTGNTYGTWLELR